jgi:hypothetical protein
MYRHPARAAAKGAVGASLASYRMGRGAAMLIPTEEYRGREYRNWLVRDGILRLKRDRHYLFGLSWDVIQVHEPDCGCRFICVTFAPLPMVTLSYEWYRDNPACSDVIARGDDAEDGC